MVELLRVRTIVLSLLEKARVQKYVLTFMMDWSSQIPFIRQLKSSLEAEVDIFLPGDPSRSPFLRLLQREGLSCCRLLYFTEHPIQRIS